MSHTGEFELIERIRSSFFGSRHGGDACAGGNAGVLHVPDDIIGIGDDCAVMPQTSGLDTLVTTDLLIEDRHFLLSDVAPEQLGWKSAAVNISDIAAMGGRPTGSFLSIAIPKRVSPEWVERFISGFRDLSGRFSVPLLGGDTSASPDKLFINVTLLGECRHGSALLRSTAVPGDMICVTGPLGDAAAGLKLILERAGSGGAITETAEYQGNWSAGATTGAELPEQVLVRRHYCPMPRVAEGLALAAVPGVHAAMDISDGIASDLRHILKASGVRARVDLNAVPLSPELRLICTARGWDAAGLAVSGGEDYELLFTVEPCALAQVREALGGKVFPIGEILPESHGSADIRWVGGSCSDYQGFTHF